MKWLINLLAPRVNGGASNLDKLVHALARRYPDDEFHGVTFEGSGLLQFDGLANATRHTLSNRPHREWTRFAYHSYSVRGLVSKVNPDVVWNVNLGPYIRTGAPQVITLNNAHQVYPWSVTRYHPGNRAHVALLRSFFRRSLACADGVIVQTGLMKEYVSRVAGCPEFVSVIPKPAFGEDEARADVAPAPLVDNPNGLYTFVYISTNYPHKNHQTVFRAMRILAERERPARLLVSLGADEVRAIEPDSGDRLIQSGQIVPLGWVKPADLPKAYAAAHASVHPSLLESLSSAHLEAMKWRLPLIAADLPYARDLCQDAALYVAPQSPEGWADAMERVRDDALLRSRLADLGTARLTAFPAGWGEMAGLVREAMLEVCGSQR